MTYEVDGQLSDYGVAPYLQTLGGQPSYFVTLDQDTGRERTFWGAGLQDALLDREIGPSKGDYISLQNNGPDTSSPKYSESNPGPASWNVNPSNRYKYHSHKEGTYDSDPHNPNRAPKYRSQKFGNSSATDAFEDEDSPSLFPRVLDEKEKLNTAEYAKSFTNLKEGDNLFEVSQRYVIKTGIFKGQPAVIFSNKETDKPAFMMQSHALDMAEEVPSLEDVRGALKLAQAKWGNDLSIKGPPLFMDMVAKVIQIDNLPIKNIAEKSQPKDFTWNPKSSQDGSMERDFSRSDAQHFSEMLKSQLKMNTYRGKPPKPQKLPKIRR